MKKLKDRVAVVTGAASGIGRATAQLLAERGCALAISDVNEQGLAETAELIRKTGQKVTTYRVDVSNKAQMEDFAGAVVQDHGGANILINNAGVAVIASFKDHSLEDFEWLMGVNFWGVVYGCKFFLPALLKADEGHIVNISSLFGLTGVPQQTSYCASKFAVRGFTESLRIELSGKLGVTSVHPGGINTNIVADSRIGGGPSMQKQKERVAKSFKKMLPPSHAAERILGGILGNKSRVLIAPETFVIDGLKRLAPEVSTDLTAWGYHRFAAKRLSGARS